ncbi:hypothetical protein TWF569_000109 [Orbilia oligospora]|uniref:Uncharacterized protein n=1 Tax=Orbilia oligospora TaxID=2813651 RepID=A0A7C8ND71_ORBOL|nr:hypothetical protein TWF102_003084 [Orbilia oligospora]KAF3109401.1 hypothetical protein TWF103_005271 [Orbilia oligospora]KAF3150570.1 hypothetical protein TWF594_009210 [Orbilia oligospora]KAF3157540.1 hypothetical protein TWF569_000109 [Orbilia oligospora]
MDLLLDAGDWKHKTYIFWLADSKLVFKARPNIFGPILEPRYGGCGMPTNREFRRIRYLGVKLTSTQ